MLTPPVLRTAMPRTAGSASAGAGDLTTQACTTQSVLIPFGSSSGVYIRLAHGSGSNALWVDDVQLTVAGKRVLWWGFEHQNTQAHDVVGRATVGPTVTGPEPNARKLPATARRVTTAPNSAASIMTPMMLLAFTRLPLRAM